MNDCPFCNIDAKRIILDLREIFGVLDLYPVTEGHTLLIPKRHVETVLEMTHLERTALWNAIDIICDSLKSEFPEVEGFNIGMNCRKVAGQTVPHAHIHIIPRREGDMEDPRGGVRGVIPDKQKY